ncbi:MAG: hypothetical protein ACRDRW_17105 [Pseudonocardiaceae bacterium]
MTTLPAHPGTPECLATLIRQHWGIESLHWLRDITEATRSAGHDMHRPFTILKLTS